MAKRKLPSKVYYSNDLQEFEDNHLKREDLDENYVFIKKGFKHFLSNIIYFIGNKILYFFSIIFLKVKLVNKKKTKCLKHKGFFIYMNHTSDRDPFILQGRVFPHRKLYIMAYSDALSIPVFGKFMPYIGMLPLPNNIKGLRKFNDAVKELTVNRHKPIIIFPEQQMWPYCSFVRKFNQSSFHYPADLNLPVLPIATIYRNSKRRIKKDLKPRPTLVVLDPIYPNENLSKKENKEYLATKTYEAISNAIKEYNSFTYIDYQKVDSTDLRAPNKTKFSLLKSYKEELKKSKQRNIVYLSKSKDYLKLKTKYRKLRK